MKMKKLLSIGALSLVVACATSVGASAAERPSNAEIKKDMKEIILEGKNPLNYPINSNKTVGSIADKDTIKEVTTRFSNYPNIVEALKLIDTNKTFKNNVGIIVAKLSPDQLDGVVDEVRSIAVKLREIENAEDTAKKIKLEKELKALVEVVDSNITVDFGKNKDGKATMLIRRGNEIVLQLNSANAYTISNALKGDNILNLIKDAKNFINNF